MAREWGTGLYLRRFTCELVLQRLELWAKGFDQSAPCGALRLGDLPDVDAEITLRVNGEVRQSGRLGDMILDPQAVLAAAGALWSLQPGDLIFTGTPEGVGPLVRGDRVQAAIGGLPDLRFTLA